MSQRAKHDKPLDKDVVFAQDRIRYLVFSAIEEAMGRVGINAVSDSLWERLDALVCEVCESMYFDGIYHESIRSADLSAKANFEFVTMLLDEATKGRTLQWVESKEDAQ